MLARSARPASIGASGRTWSDGWLRARVTATILLGAIAVAFTLVVNLARGYQLIAMAGTVLVAGVLYWRWVHAGRPRGIEAIERQAETEDDA